MSDVTNKLRYLEGLAEGKEISKSGENGDILDQLVKLTASLAERVDQLEEEVESLRDFKESFETEMARADEFLQMLFSGMDGEGGIPFPFFDDDEDDDDYFNEADLIEEESEDDDMYEVECANCGNKYYASFEDFMDDDVVCPKCGTSYSLSEDVMGKLQEHDHEHN